MHIALVRQLPCRSCRILRAERRLAQLPLLPWMHEVNTDQGRWCVSTSTINVRVRTELQMRRWAATSRNTDPGQRLEKCMQEASEGFAEQSQPRQFMAADVHRHHRKQRPDPVAHRGVEYKAGGVPVKGISQQLDLRLQSRPAQQHAINLITEQHD